MIWNVCFCYYAIYFIHLLTETNIQLFYILFIHKEKEECSTIQQDIHTSAYCLEETIMTFWKNT